MNDTKPWYASSTVWGGLLAAIAPLIALILHVSISGDDVQTIATALAGIGAAVGGIVAIVGRIRATKTIAPSSPPVTKQGS